MQSTPKFGSDLRMRSVTTIRDFRAFLEPDKSEPAEYEQEIRRPIAMMLDCYRRELGGEPANGLALAGWVARQLKLDLEELECWTIGMVSGAIDNLFNDAPDEYGNVPEHPNGWPDWLPKIIDPTPLELLDLRKRLQRLAEAVLHYESELVGQTFRQLFASAECQACVNELLDALLSLGDWKFIEDPLYEAPSHLAAQGWPDPLDWIEHVSELFFSGSESICRNGMPFNDIDRAFTIYSTDSPKSQFKWNHDSWVQEDSDLSLIPPIAGVNPEATLLPMEQPFESDGGYGVHEKTLSTFVSQLLVYADEVKVTIWSLDNFHCPAHRSLRFDVTKIRGLHGYAKPPKGHLFYSSKAVAKSPWHQLEMIEHEFRIRLRKGGDPIWLVEQYLQCKESDRDGFAERLLSEHPDLVKRPKQPAPETLPDWLGESSDSEALVGRSDTRQCVTIAAANDDAMEDLLQGLSLKLFKRLRMSKHKVSFESLLDDVWEKRVTDRAITSIIEKANTALGDTHLRIAYSDRRAYIEEI